MEFLSVENDSRWKSLLRAQPTATLFHTSAWLRFQERSFGYRLKRIVARHRGADVGLFPLFVTRRGPFRVAASPRGIDYLVLGPLVPAELLGELLDAYEDWARLNRVAYTSIAFSGIIDESVASARGYTCDQHVNCVVDLSGGADAIFGRMKSECRRHIRQAERANVKIIEGALTPLLDKYVRLSREIYSRSGVKSPLTKPMISDMLETLTHSDGLLSIRAEVDGEVAGMWIGAAFRGVLYGLDTVSDRAFRNRWIGNMMNWYAIQWGCRRDLKALDLGGGRIPAIAEFKKSFGAEMIPYSNIAKPHTRLARAALGGMRLVNATRSLLRGNR